MLIERKLLYYPTIIIPPSWLKWAILYWDKVSSIIPETWEDDPLLVNQTSKEHYQDMSMLKDEGIFEPMRPEHLFRVSNVGEFLKELEEIISSQGFQYILNSDRKKELFGKIHKEKISDSVYDMLRYKELVQEKDYNSNWYNVEYNTSLLYMSLLAKYLADIDYNVTTPSTDWKRYETMIYEPIRRDQGFHSLNINFTGILPVPREDVTIKDILKFKEKKREDILNFRDIIDEFQTNISHATDKNEIKEILINYREKIEKESLKLKSSMDDSYIKTLFSSFKSLLDVKTPALLGALGVTFAALPPLIRIAAISTTAAITVGYTIIDDRNKRRAALRASPYSYLYHATKAGII